MNKNYIAGGCSFTFGHELSDDVQGSKPSRQSWGYRLMADSGKFAHDNYVCVAKAGSGNSGIARRVFEAISEYKHVSCVSIMWTFVSRYDWAMPRHKHLEKTRWASISPWDTDAGNSEAFRKLANSETQIWDWKQRQINFEETKVKPFAESIYRYGANDYHETYLSWKSIIWIQNLLEKKKIPYFFTLADNTLFYQEFDRKDTDPLMKALYNEIDFTKWFSFGERMMGFNQWSLMNGYERGTTHPLDKAHQDATMLMMPQFEKIIGGQK